MREHVPLLLELAPKNIAVYTVTRVSSMCMINFTHDLMYPDKDIGKPKAHDTMKLLECMHKDLPDYCVCGLLTIYVSFSLLTD